jgi:tetratricopeptide (TPR) repeat protein
MRRVRPSTAWLLALSAVGPLGASGFAGLVAGCAHHGPPAPVGPSQHFQTEATQIGGVKFEDDFVEARLVYQALPIGVPERAALRQSLLHYLLDPVVVLPAEQLRREVRDLENDDIYDRIFDSFRDALALFDPSELWAADPRAKITPVEQDLLGRTAKLVVAVYSPRGADTQVALALAVLATIDPTSKEWPDRLSELIRWTDEAGATGDGSGFRRPTTSADILESAFSDWPSPALASPLDGVYADRQRKFVSVLRKPLGGGESSRKALGDLLLAHGDEMQRAVVNVATLYLRCGLIARAAQRTGEMAEQPGDDPELRAMLDAAARTGADAGDYLRLARRFLPRVELLGGTATDSADPLVAFRVLEAGLARFPGDAEMLILSAHVARVLSSPFLAIRRLEEAKAVVEATPGAVDGDQAAKISTELLELYFVRLRLRLDPERVAPAFGEADLLRQRSAETRRRFQKADIKIRDADIDFEVARSYLNAGLIDRAEPLFLRARSESEPTAEISIELANLSLKRGDPRHASEILREALDAMRAKGAQQDTIGSVEGRSRLERLLGDTYDVAGDRGGAETAWREALVGWERLMIEHLRRKSYSASAEATFEVGRLLYLLGRHAEGMQKFDEALEQDSDRDQSYIDMIAFLVQNGESDAAISIYHRAIARPNRAVSEYVKVYTSLWVLDLSRRSNKVADGTAETYLRTLDQRHPELRPHRGALWYRQLARYAVGKIGYADILAAADTRAKQAEIYFYEAMHQLEDGKADDAHQLWQKVVDTKMFSFFEFDMASRYLRVGAPSSPPAERSNTATETI